MEKHIITEPTIVRIPPYTWHCPLEYKRVGKPVYFEVLHLRGKFGAFFRRLDADGNPTIVYGGASGHMPCRLDKSKQCNFCGRCWKLREAEYEANEATRKK